MSFRLDRRLVRDYSLVLLRILRLRLFKCRHEASHTCNFPSLLIHLIFKLRLFHQVYLEINLNLISRHLTIITDHIPPTFFLNNFAEIRCAHISDCSLTFHTKFKLKSIVFQLFLMLGVVWQHRHSKFKAIRFDQQRFSHLYFDNCLG